MARVVVIAGYGPSLVNFRGPLIRAMVNAGHEVVALGPEPHPPRGFTSLGASYRSSGLERTGMLPHRDLRALARLVRLLRALRPDVVLAYTMKPVVYGMLAARLAGIHRRYALVTGLGYLFIDDGSQRQRWVRRVAHPLLRLGLAQASAVFVQNPDDERDLREGGFIQNGTPVARFAGSGIDRSSYPERPLPEGPPSFLFVGRLLRDKGVRELVAAARTVRSVHPEVTVRVVGPSDPNPSGIPEDEVEAWRRDGVVEICGETDDVRPYLAGCTVYVLPSYREGTPRSVLEAMSTGRPIITSDAPGCRETVRHQENGFLVPVADAEALAAAMSTYIERPSLVEEHARRSAALAAEVFDVNLVNAAMLEAMGL